MLSNLETDREKLVQIVLVGQDELKQMLRREELRQLKQRIPGILDMKKLQAREIEQYIKHRLYTAGLSNGHLRFTTGAMEAICEHSDGIPRMINLICEGALSRGYLERTNTIRRDIVENSFRELVGADF
jgi:general secretion pathway protein A